MERGNGFHAYIQGAINASGVLDLAIFEDGWATAYTLVDGDQLFITSYQITEDTAGLLQLGQASGVDSLAAGSVITGGYYPAYGGASAVLAQPQTMIRGSAALRLKGTVGTNVTASVHGFIAKKTAPSDFDKGRSVSVA